jgi:hypothetical protein
MTKLKIWRKNFKSNPPVYGFNWYLHEFKVKSNLWPRVWIILIYLTGKELNKCTVELYNKKLDPIQQ